MKLKLDHDRIRSDYHLGLDLLGADTDDLEHITAAYFASLQNEINRNFKLIEDRLNGDTPAERSEGDVRQAVNGGSRSEADE